jgi:hypothetical protein
MKHAHSMHHDYRTMQKSCLLQVHCNIMRNCVSQHCMVKGMEHVELPAGLTCNQAAKKHKQAQQINKPTMKSTVHPNSAAYFL